MRTKLKITEGIFPMPVLMVATYNEDGSVNVMNAAWGTMQERDSVVLNLTETHKTVQNIKARGVFTVSIADAAHIVEADYFGVESGNKVADKFARSGLTASKAETVDIQVICRKENEIWIGSAQGLFRYNMDTELMKHYIKNHYNIIQL